MQYVTSMMSAVLGKVLNSSALFPFSHHVSHTLDLQQDQHMDQFLGAHIVVLEPQGNT